MANERKKKFIFKDLDGKESYNKNSSASELSRGNAYKYNQKTDELSTACENLDRIDEFGSLIIPQEVFVKKNKEDDYGIELKDFHKNGEVFPTHQKEAALRFLKELRGFGLLADVVGSGKTFEAGLVLSELAARNKIKSLLVVAPAPLIGTWKKVLERCFGLGIGQFVEVKGNDIDVDLEEVKPNIVRPKRPIIVSLEDFATWKYDDRQQYLFDAIIVDEAHNLSIEDENHPERANAMFLLSSFMKTKSVFGNNYCILLSATPHSGTLDSMFRLWYFIRCKGGTPKYFISKNYDEDSDFKKERDYYKKDVCENANTVMEFVKNSKIKEIRQNYKEEFDAFLNEMHESFEDLNQGSEEDINGNIFSAVDEFLNKDENHEIKEKVLRTVANSYHNKVLRPIMVRQSKDKIEGLKQKIITTNIFYFPLKKALKNRDFDLVDLNGAKYTASLDNLTQPGQHYNDPEGNRIDEDPAFVDGKCITYTFGGKTNTTTIKKYVKDNTPQGLLSYYVEAGILMDIANNLGDCNSEIFGQKNVLNFIRGLITSPDYPKDIKSYFRTYNYKGIRDDIKHKFEDFKAIVNHHDQSNIVVFFDYESIREDSDLFKTLHDLIDAEPNIRDRVIIARSGGSSDNLNKIEEEYNRKDNAILICENKEFTEGINLQKGNVIINFTVTADPLAMSQRIGRVDRLGQAKQIFIYSLANLNELEGFTLPFLSAISIMNSNNNDATIISGSSNEKMMAIQCKNCEKVKLIAKEKYDFYEKLNLEKYVKDGVLPEDTFEKNGFLLDAIEEIYCNCKKKKGTFKYGKDNFVKMREVNITTLQCNNKRCRAVFRRTSGENSNIKNKFLTDGYLCVADTYDKMVMQTAVRRNGEEEERRCYQCSKLCIMKHCQSFQAKYKDCPILQQLKIDPNFNLQEILAADPCGDCDLECPNVCRPTSSVDYCISKCPTRAKCSEIGGYTVRPHILTFDEDWRSKEKCPRCQTGYLEQIKQSTFNKFVRNSWLFKGDNREGFSHLLENEYKRVNEIRNILVNDDEEVTE